LSFHPGVASLIDAMFDYRVRPMRAMLGQLDLCASSLMLGAGQSAQAIDTLAGLLALTPTQLNAGGLVLLQMTRIDAELRHPLDEGGVGRPIHADHYWTREGRHAIGRLRLAKQPIVTVDVEHAHVGCREAGRYLDYMYDYGSHFISCLRMGDKYFQVLACQPQRYALLQRLWLPWIGQDDAGPGLQGLVNYLGEEWIAGTGRVTSATNHAFDGDTWHAPDLPVGESLIAPLLRQARGLPAAWPADQDGVPVGIEFNPHSPYMEPQRAMAWQQVFQGTMLQRFGDRALWHDDVAKPASASNITPALRRAEHAAAHSSNISELTGVRPSHGDLFASRLDVHGELSWTARAGACLLALSMDAKSVDGSLPTLRLRGGVSSESHIFTRALRGALLIEHADGCLEALFAGLRFTAGMQGRSTVSAELSRPDVATLIRVRVPLLALLTDAEARWTRALADREPALAHAIRREISWLLHAVSDSGVMLSDAAHRAFWSAFYKRGALLILCGPGQPVAAISTASVEWMQAANALLFQLRLDQPADLPASELAAIDQALLTLLEQATSAVVAPDEVAIAALHACLQQLDLARNHIALASHALLHRADLTHDASAVLLLAQLIQSREDPAHPPLTSASRSDGHLVQVTTLLDGVERDYQLGRLLSELSLETTVAAIDVPLALLEGADRTDLTPTQWRELPAEAWTVFEPLIQVDAKAADALRTDLQAYAALGRELATLIASLKWQWHAYYRAHWPRDFAEPTSTLQRIHLRACRLDSLLAGMIFSRAPAPAQISRSVG
jgi:hypothetical protein